jgi:hypothetical protein
MLMRKGGTSGSVVANRLANSPSKPKVLLLEAGGPNQGEDLRRPETRYGVWATNPDIDLVIKVSLRSILAVE